VRRAIALTAAVAAVCGASEAHAATIKSTVDHTGTTFGPGFVGVRGNILSTRHACLSRRVVRMTALVAGERIQLSTDVSSLNGYWGGEGASGPPDEIRIRMKPKRLSKRRRCSGDRDSYIVREAQPRVTSASELHYHALAYAGDQVGGAGHIESVRRCLSRRTVKVFDFDDGVRGRRRASDVSSRNGWWGAFGPSDSEGVKLALAPKRLGPNRRCGGDAIAYDPDPN
jgi:hypothetical protein